MYVAWRPQLFPIFLITAALIGAVTGIVFGATGVRLSRGGPLLVTVERRSLAGDEWRLWGGWERDTLPGTILRLAGFGPGRDDRSGEQAIRDYFRITSQIRAAGDQPALAESLTRKRQQYENAVERQAEDWIAEAVGAAGLKRRLPLFGGTEITWPPPRVELTTPPRILVRSPRDRIARAGDTLLRNDLSVADAERIERETDTGDMVSIVEPVGGLAAYPAVVSGDRPFDGWLDTTAHEWVHHYLAFFPLGERWGDGGAGVTLNETTANLAGREIASLIRTRHPLKLPQGEDGGVTGARCTAEPIDFSKELHGLRLEVDALLASGKVTEAESVMEQRRRYLGEHCVFIRKINQAYFAFHGSYADSAAASDPIGPKVQEVWERTKDLGMFLRVMREVRSVAELDSALATLGKR